MSFTSHDIDALNDLIPTEHRLNGWVVAAALPHASNRPKEFDCVVLLGQVGDHSGRRIRASAETWDEAILFACDQIDTLSEVNQPGE